jgi:transcriptional regulator with XRE-family HTH domain
VDATYPPWLALPAAREAAAAGRHGTLVRIARTAAGLTLDEAGRLAGYSAATLSRIERGRQALTDVNVLRHLATVFAIPPDLFGLAEPARPTSGQTSGRRAAPAAPAPERIGWGDGPGRREEPEPAATGVTPAAATSDASKMVDFLEEMLLDAVPLVDGPATVAVLRSGVAAARADYRACRYRQLARRLPWLLRTAMAGCDGAGQREDAAPALLAEAYNLTTLLLIKLHENGMAWVSTDRALRATRAADHPAMTAETARLTAIVLRRSGHHRRARQMAITAAERLAADTGLGAPGDVAAYSRLLATAAYTAAMADDRAEAWELLGRAEAAARERDTGDRFTAADIVLYKISIARALGDYGTAIAYARSLNPDHLSAPERRARYWQDTALALHARGRYDDCRLAVLAAERTAPQEVRLLSWARQLGGRPKPPGDGPDGNWPQLFHAEAA